MRSRATQIGTLRLLAFLCALIPLIVYSVVGLARFRQIQQETDLRLDRAVRIAREHALKVLETNETVLDRLVDRADSADDALAVGAQARSQGRARSQGGELHELLKQISRDRPQIHSIWILNSEGAPVATDRDGPMPHANAADRSYFQWHQQRRVAGTFVSEPLIGRITGKPFFDMSRGRYAVDGTFQGIVSISLKPSYFEQFHDGLMADEPDMAVTMFREDGTVLTRWPPLTNAPARLGSSSGVMALIANGQTGGSATGRSTLDGRERLLRYEKLGTFPVYIAVGMDAVHVRGRWFDEMWRLVAIGSPPLLGVIIAVVLALRRTRDSLEAAHKLTDETKARQRVEEALLQAQKLEALGRLTGGVAHDFNNALMVISSNLFILRRRHPDTGQKQIESIGRAVEAATRLTRQLLAFTRRQALVPKLTRLQDLLPSFRDLLAPVLGSQIELSIVVDPLTDTIFVDPAELELALLNVAINARDAMPDGGAFELVARNASSSELPAGVAGPCVLLSAKDTGIGIPADVIDRVFEPFFTTKPVGKGTGLGLSQIYGLCQRAGGTATVESRTAPALSPDAPRPLLPAAHGTVVRMFFGSRGQTADAALPAEEALRRLEGDVLVVEDNEEVATALVPMLVDLGARVERVGDAASALATLAQGNSKMPDLLLSDVVMPGEMSGLQLAERLRELHPTLPIVLMTGYTAHADAITKAGFEVIPKPFSATILFDAIDRARKPREP